MSVRGNTAVVRRAVEEIWNNGDLDVADILFASTYINHGGLIPDLISGPEAMKVGVALFRTAFPRLHVTIVGLVAEGKTVEVRWSASSRAGDGETESVPTDQPETLTGTTFGRLSHDQIVESWTFWDRAGVLKRMEIDARRPGLEPEPWIFDVNELVVPAGTGSV